MPTSDERSAPGEGAAPHDLELEAQVVGALLTPGTGAVAEAAAEYGSRLPELFYRPAYRHIARAFLENAGADEPEAFSPLVAAVALERAGTAPPGEATWLAYAIDTQAAYGGLGGAATALGRLDELSTQRNLLAASLEVAEAVRTGKDTAGPLEALGAIAERTARSGRSNWAIADLATIADGDVERPEPAWLRRTDGQAYLYPGRSHFITALPKVGKGWVTIRAAADVVEAGAHVIYIDPEDTPHTLVDRLKGLGVTPADIGEHITYIQPAGPLGPGERAALLALAGDRNAELVVIDGMAEILAQSGVDEDRNSEVARWWASWVRPLERLGVTVLIVDHTTKPEAPRGRGRKGGGDGKENDWARGAGHKRGAVTGAHYHLTSVKAPTYQQSGELRMWVAADRPGAIPRSESGHTATIHIAVDDAGTVTRVALSPPVAATRAGDDDGTYVSLAAARAMSNVLGKTQGTLEVKALYAAARAEGKKWSADTLDGALGALVANGYAERDGAQVRHVKPFREGEEF